jgi:hypothetical protein
LWLLGGWLEGTGFDGFTGLGGYRSMARNRFFLAAERSIELEEKVWTSLKKREGKLEQGKGRKLIQDCFSGSPA